MFPAWAGNICLIFWSDATLFQIKFGPSLVLLGGEVQYCSQFCAFLYRKISSLLFRMNAISETTMTGTPWFWLYECLARLAPVLCLSLQSGELPNVWVELENSKLCFGSTET